MADVLRPRDVARLLDVDDSTVRRWIADGLLPAFKTPGGQFRIHRADAERLLPPITPEPTEELVA